MDVYIYMTGKAWESKVGKEIGELLEQCDFTTTNMSFEQGGDLREGIMEGFRQDPEDLHDLDCLFLSLDPVKGEFYEMLTIWDKGEGGWQRTSNRPRDLDPVLDVRTTVLCKEMPLDRTRNKQQRRQEC